MKPFLRPLPAFALCVAITLLYSPAARTSPAENKAGAATRALLDARTTQTLSTHFSGDADALAALATNATPKALLSADLDRDGAPDLVVAYSTATGGVIAVTRGNPDAFAPKDRRFYRAAAQAKVPPAFLGTSRAYAIPESPDFLATGDFNRDGFVDVIVAKRGGGLYLLASDGRGELKPAQRIVLSGEVTALAANGAGDLAVGIRSGGNSQLLVFNPANSGISQPAVVHALSAPATAIQWGSFGGRTSDVAIASGKNLSLFYDALNPAGHHESITLGFQPQTLAVGDFIWDRENRMEIAALAADGTLHVLQHGSLDSAPLSAAEARMRRAQASARMHTDPADLGGWQEATPSKTATDASMRALNVTGAVTTHLLSRTVGGVRPTVVLSQASLQPQIVNAAPLQVYSVSDTTDADPINACSDGSVTATTSGLTLRSAVCEANNLLAAAAGPAEIDIQPGTYILLANIDVGPQSTGGEIDIVGQGATAADVVITRNTGLVSGIFLFDPNYFGGLTSNVSNLTLYNGAEANGYGGGAVLAGGVGDSYTFTNVVFDSNQSNAGDQGGAINFSSDGSLTLANCTFSSNTANSSSSAAGTGGGLYFQGNAGSASLTITNSSFINNISTVDSSLTNAGQGGAMNLSPGSGNGVSISGTSFTGNTAQSATGSPSALGGAIYSLLSPTVVQSRFYLNTADAGSGFYEGGGAGNSATIVNNWWGCNAGPNNTGCDRVDVDSGGSAITTPNLVLSASTTSNLVWPGATATIHADLSQNSLAATGLPAPNGTPVSFSATLGGLSPASSTLAGGEASSTYTAGSTPGADNVVVTVDAQQILVPITVPAAAAIISPTPGSTLPGSTVTFTWTAGSGVTLYRLHVGTTPGGMDVASVGGVSVTSATVKNIPSNGATLYVTLYSQIGGAFYNNAYTYTEYNAAAATITSPTNGSTLSGSTVTFTWSGGVNVTDYRLHVGTTPGGTEIASVGAGTASSINIKNIPTNGSTVYVTLFSKIGTAYVGRSSSYTAYNAAPATMITPVNGSLLSGSTITFNWTTGTNVTDYRLRVGTTPGAYDIASVAAGTNTSATVKNIPTSGATLYVTLFSKIGSSYVSQAYTYTTGP